jgi:phospholipid/cholesterol/gamma-HCH transport system ATP-binding protein
MKRSSAAAEPSASEEGDYPIVVEGLRNAFGDHVIHEDLDR